jgi:transposase-like protein
MDTEKGVKNPRRCSMTKRKSFTAEFKREAVRLLESSKKRPSDLPGNLGFDAINYTNGKSN